MVTRFRDNPGAKLETAVRYTFCEYALPPGQVRIRAATSSDLGGGCRRDEQGDTTHRDRTNETPNHCVPPLTQREENAASCQCPQSNTSSERGGDRLFPGDGTIWRSPESALSDSEFIPLQTGSPRIPPRPLERLRLTCDGAGRQNCLQCCRYCCRRTAPRATNRPARFFGWRQREKFLDNPIH
jgi:hypothetical protein